MRIAVLILGLMTAAAAADDAGTSWLAAIDRAERVPHSYSVVKQTITTSSGAERTLKAESWSAENGDLTLMLYIEPPRVRGDKILLREGGDQIWYYMSRRDLVRHFSGGSRKQKVMGSDFSYQDLAQGRLTEDFNSEFIGPEELDATACVKLRMTPTESGPSYDHLLLWAGRDDTLSRRIDYFDEDGVIKTLTLSDYRKIDGRLLPLRYEMTNLREGSRTVMSMDSLSLKVEPDPELFTKAALERGTP